MIGKPGAIFVENAIEREIGRSSDRKRAANRANALKSTGPKSDAGKARASRNALRHGMRSSTGMLPDTLAPALQEATARWIDELRPEGQAEIALVKQAAHASVCMGWLSEQQVATITRQVRRAGEIWDDRQARAALEESKLLDSEPEYAISLLRNSSAGCELLIDLWNDLLIPLREGRSWSDDDRNLLVRLLGQSPDDLNDEAFQIQLLSCELSDSSDPALKARDSKARGTLSAFVEQKMDELENLGKRLWNDLDGSLRREAEAAALLPRGKTAGLHLRYQGMHSGGLHRAVNLLIKIRTLDASPRPNDFRGRANRDAASPIDAERTRRAESDAQVPSPSTETAPAAGPEAVAPNEAKSPSESKTCIHSSAPSPLASLRSAIRNGDPNETKSIPTRPAPTVSNRAEPLQRAIGLICLVVGAFLGLSAPAVAAEEAGGFAAPNEAKTSWAITSSVVFPKQNSPLFEPLRRAEAADSKPTRPV